MNIGLNLPSNLLQEMVDIQNREESDKYLGSIQFSTMTSTRLINKYQEYLDYVNKMEGE